MQDDASLDPQPPTLDPLELEILEFVGEGAFGEVSRARIRRTGQVVAVKSVYSADGSSDGKQRGWLRELALLQSLRHPNVLHVIAHVPQSGAFGGVPQLVLEYCAADLATVIRYGPIPLPTGAVRALMRQALQGLAACHAARVLHRDLKPSNLLLTDDGVLKVADFGQARLLDPVTSAEERLYTAAVATRWYRAPEALFGSRRYSTGLDLWALGCIFAELLGGAPLFAGETDLNQLACIMRVMGSDIAAKWPGAAQLPDYGKVRFVPSKGVPLSDVLPQAPPFAFSLLATLLHYDPGKRGTAVTALQHPYFTDALEEDCQKELRELVRAAVSARDAARELSRNAEQTDTDDGSL